MRGGLLWEVVSHGGSTVCVFRGGGLKQHLLIQGMV